jgi:hypothetical protein
MCSPKDQDSSSLSAPDELDKSEYLKLRTLVGPINFESDPVVTQNRDEFIKSWKELHNPDAFLNDFKKVPYSQDCYGVHMLNGVNDAAVMRNLFS